MKVFRKSIIIALCCAHQGAMAWSLISLSKDTCRTPFSFFSFQQNWTPQSTGSQVSHRPIDNFKQSSTLMASLMFASVILMGSPVLADEYGVEKEAPTIFTGETVEICTKRGPLGACVQTKKRTLENDNDKSLKYFLEPSDISKKRDLEARTVPEEGSLLVERLRRQTEENKEKNDLLVKQKTLLNDQSASFGPFDRQVVIMNADGKGFTLLQNPQAMRLKNAGLIKDRQFVRQPTEEELEKAIEVEGPSLAEAFTGLFGRGD